ncbi:sigma-70 family RNA polymerase sigma factor [Frigoriglobus tundricola]|uniref:ECF RNA polymerase sigma factor SigE n=1 Tax=Frigoriglobus tundricola TaxID=2774151 RepID=A0A6M5Z4D8_9BACT|nr:sigma-70 family RNA polymerase sigma factor [Frigoriglobus tundricola]QJX01278.1 hypothetical protein FTUN_8920 [Frigoriglobus tundricola]
MTQPDGVARDCVRTWLGVAALAGWTDRQLLDRFVAGGGSAETAFAALVARHGPMVLRACRTVLRDRHDAEDAFQATFLVLAQRGASLWLRESLGPWLHRVASRAAIRLRDASVRRCRHECRAAVERAGSQPTSGDLGDLGMVLHAELDRLPERFRGPVVLCDLEGRTHEEAAAQLGYPVGTVKSRLSRARERLRIRLERRGILPTAGGLGVLLAAQSAPAMPRALSTAVIGAARRVATNRGFAGTGPATIVELAEGVVRTMTRSKIAIRAAVLVMCTIATAGVVALAAARPAPPPVTRTAPVTTPVFSRAPVPADPVPKGLLPFQGIWKVDLCDSATNGFGATPGEAQKGRWAVKGDAITWSRDGEEWAMTLRVDSTKKPMEIDLAYRSGPFKDEKCLGMYEWGGIDGKTLMISIQDPGAKAPRPKAIEMQGKTSLIFLRKTEAVAPKK